MKNIVHIYSNTEKLKMFLETAEVYERAARSKSILVQVFSAQNNQEVLKEIVQTIEAAMPKADVIGTTTVGEISAGYLRLGEIILSFSFFDFAKVKIIVSHCIDENETEAGEKLINNILNTKEDIRGVLLLATPLTVDVSKVLRGMSSDEISFPVFGGGAGSYYASKSSGIFWSNEFLSRGIIAAVFIGKELQIYARSNLGWQPLGREMTVTESDGMIVKKIDDMEGFDLYKRYLNIKNDENFFLNVLEFPFLVNRDGYTVARVPFFAREDNSIEFIGDIVEGEKFRIGYGDPDSIIQSAKEVQNAMALFKPEAIFIYACICRRFLMQNDVNLETQPFDLIAPTTGFFTYGEFFGCDNKIRLLNSTIVVVGMREGNATGTEETGHFSAGAGSCALTTDLYSDKHNRIISRLLYFIGHLTSELEKANSELTVLSELDKLTQLYNRMKLDTILKNAVKRSSDSYEELSVAILDIDYFKMINDQQGHLTGDHVLIEVASVLIESVKESGFVGRWGGEEFLIIFPVIGLKKAVALAEKIRKNVEMHDFKEVSKLTCSFGVSVYHVGDSEEMLIQRADNALYKAKNNGRNRVEFQE